MSQIQINNTINSVNVESTFNTVDVNNDISNILVIPQQITNVVEIVTPGPQGPPGPAGSGSFADTGSFVTTGSFNSFTSSYNTGSFTGTFTGNGSGLTGIVSASYALTASYFSGSITNAISASYATTASYALNGRAVGIFTDQFLLLASGSNTDVDGGIIIQNSSNGSGHAFGYGTPENRWVLQSSLNSLSSSFASIDGYVTTTQYGLSSSLPANPSYGGATYGYGNIYVSTDTGDIFIWS